MKREEYLNTFFSEYDIVSMLSSKNDSQVIRFRHKKLKKDIILRVYSYPITAFESLLSIEHENLPAIYDCICLDDGQIILEEYIDGITVSQVMETGKYSIKGAKRVLKSVCNALSILHSLNIVHRDIKPENIIIGNDGRVVLIDFNAARKISNASKDTIIMGTVGYASPEQLGVTQSDSRTDIYALGVLLNVMITGKHPSEKLAKGKVGKIIRKCTSVNPDERYQSAEKLAKAL